MDRERYERILRGENGGWTTGFRDVGPRPPGSIFGGGGGGRVLPTAPRPTPLRPTRVRERELVEYSRKPRPDPIRFGPSQATVVANRDLEPALKAARSWLGPKFKAQDFASLVGAPHHAQIQVKLAASGDLIEIEGEFAEALRFTRFLRRDPDGSVRIHNDTFKLVSGAPKGLGLEVFARQVEQASRLGIASIDCWAFKGQGWNGYYTWFRYGYDVRIDDLKSHLIERIRSAPLAVVRKADSVLDIFRTEAGREWWKANGDSVDPAIFDLKPGSRSRRTLLAYLRERRRNGTMFGGG
jgi:hypothetical protein